MPQNPTLRSLAQRLNLSIATVSHALRGSSRVGAKTRARVRRAAEKAGYRINPLLGAALSAVRRSRHQNFHGTIAVVDITEENNARFATFRREICRGAEARAQDLGFKTERFELGTADPALPVKRLPRVLYARGITGALLMPFNFAQDLSEFDFSRLAAVQMDHSLVRPHLHTILPDHYISMIHALERLRERGYSRIGLCMEQQRDARVKRKWSAAFLAFFRDHARNSGIPALIESNVTRTRFLPWYRHYRPDLVIGHVQEMVTWLNEIGVQVPVEAGFFNLNITESTGPCAGLDLQPQRLGAAGIETIVGMLHRQEYGVPPEPHTITLEAKWVDGPTIRAVT